MNGRYRYLLARLRDLMIAGGVVTAALLLCALVTALRGGVPVWPELAALAALLLMGVAVWLFVARPYRKREQALERMLRGYAGGEEEMGPVTLMGPGDERLLGELRQMLSPSQMFKLNKRQAQYLALQNQINPHFLYNTLESIRSEAMMAGLSSVADMTEALANFFRYTISKVENLVSVEDELQNCETSFASSFIRILCLSLSNMTFSLVSGGSFRIMLLILLILLLDCFSRLWLRLKYVVNLSLVDSDDIII